MDRNLQNSKFYQKTIFSTGGVLAPEKGHKLQGERSLRVKISGVGASNTVQIQRRLRGDDSYSVIETVTGEDEVVVDIGTADFIRFQVTNYDATDFGILVASGYYYELLTSTGGNVGTTVNTREESRVNQFGEITALASGGTATILTYTPGSTFIMDYVELGGTNSAQYSIFVGGVKQAVRRSNSLNLGESVQFEALEIVSGTQIRVEVTHDRPDPDNFEARIVGALR